MKNSEWTIGKGIYKAGMWLAIMGMVIAMFSFAQFLIKFSAGYYDRPESCPIVYPPSVPEPVKNNNCPTNTQWDGEEQRCIIS